jgi:hypothetical protein
MLGRGVPGSRSRVLIDGGRAILGTLRTGISESAALMWFARS